MAIGFLEENVAGRRRGVSPNPNFETIIKLIDPTPNPKPLSFGSWVGSGLLERLPLNDGEDFKMLIEFKTQNLEIAWIKIEAPNP